MTEELRTTATLVATALLRGPFEREAMLATLSRLRGRSVRGLSRLVDRLTAELGAGKRPRERDVVAALLQSRTFAKLAPRLDARLATLPPATLQAAAGAPATWDVPAITSPPELAEWLGVEPRVLSALCRAWRTDADAAPVQRHYHHRWIARRRGPPRLIEAPKARLRAVQRRILTGILQRIPTHPAAHGFVRGRSVLTFTAPHVGRRCVVRMDVADFFASLRRARVVRVFLTAGYPDVVARLLATLCATRTPPHVAAAGLAEYPDAQAAAALRWRLENWHLPQGAPTSPALGNLCAFALDARLTGLARRFGAAYTRYADDLLFSGDEAFARQAKRLPAYVGAVLLECGLDAAHRKTRIMRRSVSQRAAGLVLNVRPAVPRRERERLEALLCNCVRHGPESQNRAGRPDFRAFLLGHLAHVRHVHPAAGERLQALFARIRWPGKT